MRTKEEKIKRVADLVGYDPVGADLGKTCMDIIDIILDMIEDKKQ